MEGLWILLMVAVVATSSVAISIRLRTKRRLRDANHDEWLAYLRDFEEPVGAT